DPVDARIRLAIADWPDDAPRGSVTAFCAEPGISRKTFYALRARARNDGPAAGLGPRSRRPKTSPTRIPEDVKEQAQTVRTAYEAEDGISRKTVYALRARARNDGQAAVLEPRARRPKTSPTSIPEDVTDQAVAVRTALEASGWDCGPISVHDKMLAMGLQPPS